jgi:hypothetical protein
VTGSRVRIRYARHHPDGTVNEFQKAMFDDVKTPILLGDAGVGSGKSFEACQKLLKLSWLNRGVAGGLLVPSYAEYNRDIVPNMEDILADSGVEDVVHNQQKKTWRFPWSTKPLYVFTAEKRIKGPNLGWGAVNEYSEIPYERIEEFVDFRVRIPCPNPQVEMVGTPEDVFGWREAFVERKTKAGLLKLVRGNTRMNAFYLRPGFVEEKRASLDPLAFRLWIEGEAVKINSRAFYYAWAAAREKALAAKVDQQFGVKRAGGQDVKVPLLVHVALDFNVGNMSAICANVVSTHQTRETKLWRGDHEAKEGNPSEDKELRVFDEICLKDRQSDTYAMGNEVKRRFGTENVLITGDASGASRKTTGFSDFKVLEDMGFAVRWKAANPRLRERQNLVNGLLFHGKVKVDAGRCKGLVKDLDQVEQDERTFEKVKTNPALTHLSDALDYLCDFEFELGLKGREKFQVRSIHAFLK